MQHNLKIKSNDFNIIPNRSLIIYKSLLLPINIAHIEHNKNNITGAMKFSDTSNTIWHLIYI